MQRGDCGERNAKRGLWGKECREGTVEKEMQRGDCGERDAGRGLWGKECKEGTVAVSYTHLTLPTMAVV